MFKGMVTAASATGFVGFLSLFNMGSAFLGRSHRISWAGKYLSHFFLLAARSTAGVLAPILVNYIREYQIEYGVPGSMLITLRCISWFGILILGRLCNPTIRPVHEKHHMKHDEFD
ncbi:MAG: hypothetical protein ACU85E_10625 [Gammaproteobacteria bacterium]